MGREIISKERKKKGDERGKKKRREGKGRGRETN